MPVLKEKICIVGTGAVGTAWARALRRSGRPADCVISRNKSRARKLATACDIVHYDVNLSACSNSTVVLLCVPDNQIKSFAERLSKIRFASRSVTVAHHSGSLTSGQLVRIKSSSLNSFRTAPLHPMQTFPRAMMRLGHWDPLLGICFAFEGDSYAGRVLGRIVRSVGCRIIAVPAGMKLLYHMGGIIASNFLNANFAAARTLYRKAGFSPEKTAEILGPIMTETLRNILSAPDRTRLTGPAVRGDKKLLRQQHGILKKSFPELAGAYKTMNDYCSYLAEREPK